MIPRAWSWRDRLILPDWKPLALAMFFLRKMGAASGDERRSHAGNRNAPVAPGAGRRSSGQKCELDAPGELAPVVTADDPRIQSPALSGRKQFERSGCRATLSYFFVDDGLQGACAGLSWRSLIPTWRTGIEAPIALFHQRMRPTCCRRGTRRHFAPRPQWRDQHDLGQPLEMEARAATMALDMTRAFDGRVGFDSLDEMSSRYRRTGARWESPFGCWCLRRIPAIGRPFCSIAGTASALGRSWALAFTDGRRWAQFSIGTVPAVPFALDDAGTGLRRFGGRACRHGPGTHCA